MIRTAFFAAALTALSGAAQAHVLVRPAQAEPGTSRTLTFQVGHGCEGKPTTAFRLETPPTVADPRPEATPGWTLAVEAAGHAATWRSAGTAKEPAEFKVAVRLPSQPGPIRFVAVQTCGDQVIRWDQSAGPAGTPKPQYPAPVLTLAVGADAPAAAKGSGGVPKGLQRREDGLADAEGRPLYIFDHDTMQGMSHCVEACAQSWPPATAPKGAVATGDFGVIYRDDGTAQWTWKTKPLYRRAAEVGGEPPADWRRAR